MAVTTDTSPEYKSVTDPRTNGLVSYSYFRDIQYLPFNFTQGAAAGDITSTCTFLILQKGRYILFPKLSFVGWAALGAARTLDIGLSAYTNEAGTAVAAATTRFDSAINVAAAGSAVMGSSLAIADFAGVALNVGGVSNTDGVTLVGTIAGGTIPAATVIRGYLAVAMIGR